MRVCSQGGAGAYLAAWVQPWETVLALTLAALNRSGSPGDTERIAVRYRALALAQLRHADGDAAFGAALRCAQSGRDRGLLYLEWGHQLVGSGQEAQARDAWAQAATLLKADPWALTQALSNLGITCLRLGDLPAAERALARAVKVAQTPEARAQLSIAWRGLGSLYLWSGQVGRAQEAYRLAEEKADDIFLTVMARRGLARVLRQRGHLDEALEVLRSALLHAGVQDGAPHALFVDLAAVQALLGDVGAARASWRAYTVRTSWTAGGPRSSARPWPGWTANPAGPPNWKVCR